MANISDAYGEINFVIYANSKDEERRLLALFKEYWKQVMWEDCSYYTEIHNCEIRNAEDDTEHLKLYCEFIGAGRWAYDRNCAMTYEWLKQGAQKSIALREVWEHLNEHWWAIEYNFTDFEGGCNVLYTQSCYVEHQAGADTARYAVNDHTDYKVTAKNLVEFNYYEYLEDAKEYLGEE